MWFAKAATLCDGPWEGFGKTERFQDKLVDDDTQMGCS